MNLIEELNQAIEYIELYLTDNEALAQVANTTSYSMYHFQRIFNYLTDMPLSEYIRKRRLSLAVIDLQKGDRVLDVAIKYGYNAADSFTRAFEKQHGVTPSSMRQEGVQFKIYPPLNFTMHVRGAHKMMCKIERKDAFTVFGVDEVIDSNLEKGFEAVASFCKRCDEDGTVDAMNHFLGRDLDMMLHAALVRHDDEHYKYMICYHVPNDRIVPSPFKTLDVPASTWAIFTVEDCDMQAMWRRIHAEWLPTSGYKLVGDISFEMYYGRAQTSTGEIWVSVEAL